MNEEKEEKRILAQGKFVNELEILLVSFECKSLD